VNWRSLLPWFLVGLVGGALVAGLVRVGSDVPTLDPARIGVSAILASEECGRAWAIERLPHGDYRLLNIPTPWESLLDDEQKCVDRGEREVIDLCGRRFMLQPFGRDRARLTRLAPRFPAEVDEGCPR
jgi:hypothetical protein